MSHYTGKCDCYDTLVAINKVEDFSKVKIYADKHFLVPLRIDCQKDLMPYYPYLIWAMTKDGEKKYAHLSDRSYIDTFEEECLTRYLNDLKRYYRRCKRKKVPFDREEAIRQIAWPYDYRLNYQIELINRVEELGNKATIGDIHMPQFDKMRENFYDDLISAGWTEQQAYPWVYGWRRFFEKNKIQNEPENED